MWLNNGAALDLSGEGGGGGRGRGRIAGQDTPIQLTQTKPKFTFRRNHVWWKYFQQVIISPINCEAENQIFFSKCIGAQQILSMAIMLDKIATDQQQLHW